MRLHTWWIVLAVAACGAAAHAQTFARVTDAANPVVTDAFESGGGAWIDVDGDGDLDLVVPNGNLVAQNESLYLVGSPGTELEFAL